MSRMRAINVGRAILKVIRSSRESWYFVFCGALAFACFACGGQTCVMDVRYDREEGNRVEVIRAGLRGGYPTRNAAVQAYVDRLTLRADAVFRGDYEDLHFAVGTDCYCHGKMFVGFRKYSDPVLGVELLYVYAPCDKAARTLANLAGEKTGCAKAVGKLLSYIKADVPMGVASGNKDVHGLARIAQRRRASLAYRRSIARYCRGSDIKAGCVGVCAASFAEARISVGYSLGYRGGVYKDLSSPSYLSVNRGVRGVSVLYSGGRNHYQLSLCSAGRVIRSGLYCVGGFRVLDVLGRGELLGHPLHRVKYARPSRGSSQVVAAGIAYMGKIFEDERALRMFFKDALAGSMREVDTGDE